MVRISEGKEGLELMTYDTYVEYLREAEGGFIKINKHPENENIIILNYTDLAVYEKRWNEYTMTARGLILDLTSVSINGMIYILSKPFDKFPNYNSNEIIGYEDDIDWNEVDSVMEKMDGSLGITYILDGEIHLSTRGSLNSDQAKRATQIWKRDHAKSEEKYHEIYGKNKPTLLFEIIYPENRVVVDYGGAEMLVLIGVRDRHKDYTYEEMRDVADTLGLNLVHKFRLNLEQMLFNQERLSANNEGYVIRFKNGKRLKIKGHEYLAVHRVTHGLSVREKYKLWSEGKFLDAIRSVPEEFRKENEEFNAKLEKIYLGEMFGVLNLYGHIISVVGTEDRKAFALFLKDYIEKDRHEFLFAFYNKFDILNIVNRMKYKIFKNYRKWEEG